MDEEFRELLKRFDERTAQMAGQLRVQREENRVYFEKLRADTAEIVAEGRAQREALFRVLDRLDGGGTAPAT